MTNKKIPIELIAATALEISDRFKLISKIFPKDKEPLLKNLASASIHMAYFVRDLYAHIEGDESLNLCELEKRFLAQCGCNE